MSVSHKHGMLMSVGVPGQRFRDICHALRYVLTITKALHPVTKALSTLCISTLMPCSTACTCSVFHHCHWCNSTEGGILRVPVMRYKCVNF
jgi:hypothetical protein